MTEIEEDKKEYSLVELTQQRVLEYISSNNYEPNSLLPKENELAEILGVSRVVVREALSSLRALGFIETKRKKGTVLVAPQVFGGMKTIIKSGILTKDAIKDLYELRLMLEIGMADFLFKNITKPDLKKLEDIINKEDETMDVIKLRSLDIQFHTTLYKITNNKSLSDFQHLLGKLFTLYAPRTENWKSQEVITHRGLLKILKSGNPDSFRLAMRMHLSNQFDNQELYMENVADSE